jgi:hypothetical protein
MKRASLAAATRRNLYLLLGLCVVLLLMVNLMQDENTLSISTPRTVTLSALYKLIFGNAYAKKCDAHVLDR